MQSPMSKSDMAGWKTLLKDFPWFTGANNLPLPAYSEYMPPPRTGFCPLTGRVHPYVFSEDDPYGWQIPEIEEEYHLRPGLETIGKEIFRHLLELGNVKPPVHLSGHKQRHLSGNRFWPEEIFLRGGIPENERFVILMPVALSKTKDDKGRVLWTFFGTSEQGPEKAFWKSFYKAPEEELPLQAFLTTMNWIFCTAFGIKIKTLGQLSNLGFRILPAGDHFPFPYWKMDSLPSWTKRYLAADADSFKDVSYLLTFRPFSSLPQEVKARYLSGKLALLPFPGSLLLWGSPPYLELQKRLYNAIQIPLLSLVRRNEGHTGIRVPQSGWFHQPGVAGGEADILDEFILNTYIRTNRWNRFHRNDDALLMSKEVDPVVETLFSTTLETLDLYNKPMARNCQLLTESIGLLLDGPRANRKAIGEAVMKVIEGGLFRYRFYFPPMLAGNHEVTWHRPLAGCLSKETNQPEIAPELLTGYLTACLHDEPDPGFPIELWPRLQRRELYLGILDNFNPVHDHYLHQTSLNLMALADTWEWLGKRPLEAEFARQLVRIPKNENFDEWVESLPSRSIVPEKTEHIIHFIRNILKSSGSLTQATEPVTFEKTAMRSYEEDYWNQIFFLAHGDYRNKDNADVVQDDPTLNKIAHKKRDLHKLGDYLLQKHREAIHKADLDNIAFAGELPFTWETDFDFHHYGGWKDNQAGKEYERNILVIIPGRNRNEALIMADHYDTAYMEDEFNRAEGGSGARLSAAGADDNHSATATLLLAAPLFLEMSRKGRLERDIWLLHLTGEEFPSDCMGARNFCKNYVQRTLKLHLPGELIRDLSAVEIKGVLVMDMIAHNRDDDRDVFQVAPGNSEASLRLAFVAHHACLGWNAGVAVWNKNPGRKGCSRGERTKDGQTIPDKALHLDVKGEIRTWEDPYSTLYNTDGMIFSDTGIPVILIMENYDIHRTGYHDTHDTMENIDLDFGAAVSAIAIETIAQLALEQ
jgi:hypothetical protein